MNTPTDMYEYFVQSNLIEGVTNLKEIPKSEQAWEYLQNVDILTKQNILDIHTLVMTDLMLDPRNIGSYRLCGVRVGNRLCPPSGLVDNLMDEWLSNMKYWQDIDPMYCHVEYERIHPFRDGNGRTGRLLLWWHEDKQGETPTLITYKERNKYYRLFDHSPI